MWGFKPPSVAGPEGLKAREGMIRGMFTPQTPPALQKKILDMMLNAPEATAVGAMSAMFDPAIGFFQGRAADGEWKSTPREYDPLVWGHERDYTETDGWNFAFHVPQDGRGLANLYGGRDRLAAKLDAFF